MYIYLFKLNIFLYPIFLSNHIPLQFQNPDVVLVHYLNVPYPDDNKMLIANSVNLWAEKKEWTKEELICQLKPMCKCNYSFFPFQ